MKVLGFLIFTAMNAAYANDNGYFWHITDMHWDPTYQSDSQALSCNPGTTGNSFGQFGDYRCDPPWELINSSVHAMRAIQHDIDFIIWTGDDTPHIWNDTILHKQIVSDIVLNQSEILQTVFPDTIVYSALGNHDWSPKNQLPPNPDTFYDTIAEKWGPWLTDEASTTFKKAAYYTMSVSPQLRVIVLNTNLYYSSNALTEDMPDPANQLQWLDDVMTAALAANEKVIIVAHVPPGVFEKHRDKHWFYPFYNKVFLGLLRKHASVIGSIHMAHHHTDSFRILHNDQGSPVSSIFLGPAVTPWETTLPGTMGGLGNNPSVRLLQYNRTNGRILDIYQYYLDLTTANQLQMDDWQLEYKATEYYGVPDMTTESLAAILERMKTDDDIFGKYYRANGVLYDPDEKWSEEIRTVHLCSMNNMEYEDYDACVNPPNVNTGSMIKYNICCVLVFLTAGYLV